jgi:two-component system NtrC family sensor kinase
MTSALPASSRPRFPLWIKLALFAAVGVLVTHSISLALGARVATRSLAREQEALGRRIARLVAAQAAEAVLVNDLVALQEVVTSAAAGEGIAYCFIVRNGHVIASSYSDATPRGLVELRANHDSPPVVVVSKGRRYLDLAEPILGGEPGVVRLGLDMGILQSTRRDLALLLGVLALAVIAAGLVAAFVVGRRVARPVNELLAVADRFDPSGEALLVAPRGQDEIAVLAERFNLMMTRLRTAYEEQVRARQKAVATERMAALGSLVAGVAHEVNNPLAGMKSCLHRLQREQLPSETHDEYIDLIEEGVERVEQVMKRLLDFARPRPTSLDTVSLADLAREGTALMPPLLHKRHIGLRETLDGAGDATVLADRKQVAQALLNVLLNAAYVTPEGGEIRVRLRRRPGQCGIAVEDDGPGIPNAIRHRIMDPFFSTKPEGEGTGLGLSVTRTIAEAHGGELSFEFPERGTIATLWLREAHPDFEARPSARSPAQSV